MRAVEATEVNEPNQGSVVHESGVAHESIEDRLGQRLCAARERKGWSQADVAAQLKLPAKLIARLESDDYEGLTQGVFLQGYLASYARLVGVPVEDAAQVAAQHSSMAPLVATGTISRSRYLFDRYSVSATYLILTAIIVVPAVWLATHGGLEQNLARTTPLDPPASAVASTHEVAPSGGNEVAAETTPAAAPSADGQATQSLALPQQMEQSPVIASMAPFPAAPTPAPVPPPPADAAPAVSGSGAHTLELKLSEQSWVEITAADGRKLEYGMLAAGSARSYRSDGPVSVRLGNAQGAQVRSDGALVDLAPYQRGNVAHVKLFGDSAGASRADQ